MEFDGFTVNINDVAIDEGDYLVIVGPTGSGKSIFLETIMGFYEPVSGRILINNEEVTCIPPEKRDVSIVYQDHCLFPHMSVFENIAYGLHKRSSREDLKKKILRISDLLGIEHILHRDPLTLSGGELQRVSIARALIVRPRLLLMDEPFSALDPKTKMLMRELIFDVINDFGTTVIHVTHDFDDIWWLSNKIAVMNHGEILQIGPKEEVLNKPSPCFVAEFLGTNTLEGDVIGHENGLTNVMVGKLLFKTIDCGSGHVSISIRPENIMITKDNSSFKTSAQNGFHVRVKEFIETSRIVHVKFELSEDTYLNCTITPNAMHELELTEGKEAYILIKATNVHIINY